jgi:2-dehydropantoate 2-reductase
MSCSASALLTEANSMLSAAMLRDLERGTVTEADHALGDLLHRQSELAVNSPSLLRIAYLHLKTLRSQASERRNPFGGRLIEGGKIAKA